MASQDPSQVPPQEVSEGVAAPRGATAPERGGPPLPLRPRGGFGGYLHELRRERGQTVRQLAAAAGVHHTYVSKLERGDRQAPEEAVVEALAAAVGATPAQLDQLRWRAGLAPHGAGAPGHDDPTVTVVEEALGDPSLTPAERDRLRRRIAEVARTAQPAGAAEAPAPARAPVSASPEAPPDGRTAMVAGLLGGWQTLDEAAAELRVAPAYLWGLVQGGQLRAWALPGAPAGSAAGIRLRREDVLALLRPVTPTRRR